MYDLIPLLRTWLEKEGFAVSVLANRIDGTKKTGFFSSDETTIFLENYPEYCSVQLQGSTDVCQRLRQYLQSLPPKEETSRLLKEKEIVKEVIVKVRCPYCQSLYDETLDKCPYCGGKR